MNAASDALDPSWAVPALRGLNRARRRNRAAGVDVFEGFYQAYLLAFGCAVAVLLGSDAIGDQKASSAQTASVIAHGGGVIGLVVAAILFISFRTGSRGGPLVLPAADVRHVLLAPVPRSAALRPAAIRQIRFSAFVGAVAGAGLATIAARRFTGGVPTWAPIGAGVGLLVGVLAAAVGLAVSGRGLRPWVGWLLGLAVLGWSGIDVALGRVTSPMGLVGQLAISALKFRPVALAVIVLPAAAGALALRGIGGLSIEQAERRATLASQIRFALTLQDLRTVVLLRRQLSQEQSRPRPWVRLGPVSTGRNLVLRRDLRGMMRWPAVRIMRVVLLSIAAGAALVGMWSGTTPLLLVAALCIFLAGLDAMESLAQDVDHPDLPESTPVVKGELRLRHAQLPIMLMIVVALLAWASAIVICVLTGSPTNTVITVGAACILPAALLGAVGAAASVVMEPSIGGGDFLPAEIAGMKMIVRAIWAPLLVIVGLTPLLIARSALHSTGHQKASAAGAAISGGFLPLMVGIMGLGWLRFREDLHEYFRMQPPPQKDEE